MLRRRRKERFQEVGGLRDIEEKVQKFKAEEKG